MYHKKNRPRGFNIYRKKNELGRLSRLNAYCSYRDKPLNRLPVGLNHSGRTALI